MKLKMSHYSMLAHISLLLLMEFALVVSIDVIVPEGSGLILSCDDGNFTKAEVTFRWTFRSRVSASESEAGSTSQFEKHQFQKVDEGEYECLMERHLGDSRVRKRKVYNISVDNSTDFKQWEVITVTEGDIADLPCSLPSSAISTNEGVWVRKTKEGNFEPFQPLIWDETNDEPSHGVYWARPKKDFSIKFFGSKVQDSGMYRCQFRDLELIVEAPPPPRCYGHTAAWEQCEDNKSQTAASVTSESLTDFATKLYSQLRKANPKDNILYSPISIAGMLSHLLLGARTETRTLIEDGLCLPRGFSCSHKAMKVLREETRESMAIASHIFYNPDQTLSEIFINQSLEFYDAAPIALSDNPEKSMDMINSWVAKKTKNKIPKLLNTIDALNQLILVNAVHFDGKWMTKFDGEHPATFITFDGDMIPVQTLKGANYQLSMQSFSSLEAQVAAFPLTGQNRLFILLPHTSSLKHMQDVEERMTDTALREMAKDMTKVQPVAADVTLPKLTLDIDTDMNTLIGNIGLGELFNNPNLCGIFPEQTDMPVALSDARHRASLTLSDAGVEAAAASSLSFARSHPFFSVLQPFVLVLWSDKANCPLFIGRVTRPQA